MGSNARDGGSTASTSGRATTMHVHTNIPRSRKLHRVAATALSNTASSFHQLPSSHSLVRSNQQNPPGRHLSSGCLTPRHMISTKAATNTAAATEVGALASFTQSSVDGSMKEHCSVRGAKQLTSQQSQGVASGLRNGSMDVQASAMSSIELGAAHGSHGDVMDAVVLHPPNGVLGQYSGSNGKSPVNGHAGHSSASHWIQAWVADSPESLNTYESSMQQSLISTGVNNDQQSWARSGDAQPHLDPPVITAAILRSHHWSQIQDLLDVHGPSLNSRHIAIMLYRLPLLVPGAYPSQQPSQPGSSNSTSRDHQHGHHQHSSQQHQAHFSEPFGSSHSHDNLSRVQRVAVAKLVSQLCGLSIPYMDGGLWTPQDYANACWALARLGFTPSSRYAFFYQN